MKLLKLMKSIKSVKLIRLIKSNQVNKKFSTFAFLGIFFFSNLVIKETRTKLSIFFSCGLREQKRVERACVLAPYQDVLIFL